MIRTAELSHVGCLLTCGGTKPCLAGSDVGHGLLVALVVGKLDQCHCVDGEDDVGVDAVNLDFCE